MQHAFIQHPQLGGKVNFENERHFEPGEDVLKRMWYALKYDVKRWKRRWKEARRDPYQRNNPIAHIKRHTMDLELFPFETQVIYLDASYGCSYHYIHNVQLSLY
ncbi:unnamed protein product [Onchocerca ochengi]|uniref:Uncharacterized protein n=1 Tax=Onchocerca ochengi TaxID=42157 RepID=A0A182EUG8_ONCOC|nr:unnamed protein product [Onchocerca ochengi]